MNSSEFKTIQDYYGKILKSKNDLKTNACCAGEALPPYLREIVSEIAPEITERFYGCGSPIPLALEGATVLDLGCGTGRDAFLLSKLVGPKGRVIGVDMTPEQIETAEKYVDHHTQKFGFKNPNVRFLKGMIEDLEGLGLQNNSVDAVISNCVINLSPEKPRVFREIFRVLKPGGELFFSDIFANRRIPAALSEDPLLRGECLGGALYVEDFRRLLSQIGIHDYRITAKNKISLQSHEIEEKLGNIGFFSMTIRAFKLKLEDRCEDYGQIAVYQGGIPHSPQVFELDDHHRFEKDRPLPVCGNTAAMLSQSRYAPYFKIIGDTATHFGLFECGPNETQDVKKDFGGCC